MKRATNIIFLFTIGACSVSQIQDKRAFSLASEVERLASVRSYWPGFEPMAIPLAVYDGRQTYLFRHTQAPEGFAKIESDKRTVFVYKGRHPAVTANTSSDIGGTMTATILLDGAGQEQSVTALAAVALHEGFHVYQRERHPTWVANEVDLFVYPIDDGRLLALRRLETEALRRALAMSGSTELECWAGQALVFRAKRFARMDAKFAAYERGTELNEGIAAYVQLLAEGSNTVALPTSGFGATEVRRRAYATGSALALLLDRYDPEWPASFEAADGQNLDQSLQEELDTRQRDSSDMCEFTKEEITEYNRVALGDVAAVLQGQIERRAEFEATPGWYLVIQAADNEPLWPRGFDPLNVERVHGGILHLRFLRLGNEAGQLEMIDEQGVDIEALTKGAGSHPIFNGIQQIVIKGQTKPQVAMDDEHVTILMPGLRAKFERASVRYDTKKLVVRLKPTE